MQKAYSRINWKNEPSLDTPLGANNLNKMDSALDVIDNRVLSLSGYEGRVQASEKNAKASEVNAKTSENNAKESEELAREYAERAFNTTPEGYEQIVDTVQKMDIKESADTTLLDSKAGGYKLLSMSGNSVQKTYTGKNLLLNDGTTKTLNGVTFTVNNDKSVTCNGTATADAIFHCSSIGITLQSGNYLLSGCPKGGGESTYDLRMTSAYKDYGTGRSVNITEETLLGCTIVIRSGQTVSNLTFYPMLRLATETDATYEPYVGGIPSPNPDFPQSINNVGDCVEMINGAYADATGIYGPNTQYNNYVCSKNKIPCKSGDVIKIKTETTSYFFVHWYGENGYISSTKQNNILEIETTAISGSTHFAFSIKRDILTVDNLGKISLTINGKYVAQIPYANKNLWELGDVSGINAMGKNYKSLQIGTYTLSYVTSATSGNMNVQIYDAKESLIVNKGTQLANFNNRNSITFTLTTQAESIRFYSDTQTTLSSIQLERGEAMTDYEEHKEKVATILLDAPLRDVDVMSNKEVVRKRVSVVFDGTESDWYLLSSFGNTFGYNKIGGNSGVAKRDVGLCDRYKINASASSVGALENGQFMIKDNLYFKNTNCSTVDEWKAHLQSNPITVEYELATPIVETLDNASQIALNSLETFDGVTYITVDSRTQPKGITGEYGTSKVGARTIKNELKNDTLEIKYNELVSTLLANNEVAEVEEVLEGDEE